MANISPEIAIMYLTLSETLALYAHYATEAAEAGEPDSAIGSVTPTVPAAYAEAFFEGDYR